ncbi:Y-family DNA polymerase [Marinobacterium sp. YM272]|uniref:Y-family DNA polymerase n=1 Tax=Marinobacterium sp. YM272 TaxID=3421654 RepID=UPI003D7FC30B
MRWLCLHFPWLSLELHVLPQDSPQALLDNRQRILLANPAAEAQGVKAGQALATALALSPELTLLETSAQQLRQSLEQLALWAGGFSARISLCPPQSLLLEIASMLHYFGGLEALLEQINSSIQRSGYSAQLAVGETARGAELLARVGSCIESDSERWWARLHALNIDQLGLPAKPGEQLRGVGLRSLGDLLRLPRNELAQRFGQSLLRELEKIVEPGAALPEPFIAPERFSQRVDLAAEIIHSQGLLFPLRRLLEALEGFLRIRQQQVAQLHISLFQRDSGEQQLTIGHAGGTASAAHWLELCRLQLEREKLRAPVLALQLDAEEGQGQQVHNADLFAPTQAQTTPAELISRLRSRLGKDAVQPLGWCADHRPERACTTETGKGERPPTGLARPGWLLATPRRLSPGEQRTLHWLRGPERICSGWWDGPVQRDYYVARWPDGRCGWVFNDSSGDWFIHGWFG